ncbi:MAG TPA: 3-oxoadipate enol-lactonase [Rhodospirillales bacterium]|jgi:3-oxoadipate enol-lactonase|nr:3-oxoadipate enol-lactonase [Rhodospirillales bacterium]
MTETIKLTASGLAFNARVDGPDGAPWVTFSNSLTTSLALWDDQVAALDDRYRILRYDTRGHGGTEAGSGGYTIEALAGDVVGLWDALGIARSHVVGLSLGGATALALAETHASRLGGIVACGCRADAPPEYIETWRQRIRDVNERGLEGQVETTIERWFTPRFRATDPPVLDQVRAMIRATSLEGYLGCADALMGLDLAPRLADITVPTLIVAGAQDAGAAPAIMRPMCESIPGARYAEIDPASHICNLEQPQRFNAEIGAFLDSLDA